MYVSLLESTWGAFGGISGYNYWILTTRSWKIWQPLIPPITTVKSHRPTTHTYASTALPPRNYPAKNPSPSSPRGHRPAPFPSSTARRKCGLSGRGPHGTIQTSSAQPLFTILGVLQWQLGRAKVVYNKSYRVDDM